MTQEIINLNSNAAQPGINQEAIKSLKILVPDDDALNTFDIFIEGVLSKITKMLKKIILYPKLEILFYQD